MTLRIVLLLALLAGNASAAGYHVFAHKCFQFSYPNIQIPDL